MERLRARVGVFVTTAALCLSAAVMLSASALAAAPRSAGAVGGTAPSGITFTSTPPSDVVVGGPAYTPTATGQQPSFSIDPSTTDAACAIAGGVVYFDHAGSCVIDAQDSSSGGSAQQAVPVSPAGTTAGLVVGTSSLTATVSAAAPGGGTPSGTVEFSVGGRPLGQADLTGGVATLSYSVPPNVTETIVASYPGTADYTSSSATMTVNGPNIEPTFVAAPTVAAILTSSAPKNSHGWWHTPVHVHFICNGAGSPVLGGCPRSLVLDRSGVSVDLRRTIHTAAGKRATVVLRGLRIDLTRPDVRIAGIRQHALYHGRQPSARCSATDRVSGIRSCRLTRTVKLGSSLEAITYTAEAISWAGAIARTSETVYSEA